MNRKCKNWRHAALAGMLLLLVLASFTRWTLYPAYAAWAEQAEAIAFLEARIERLRDHAAEQDGLQQRLEALAAGDQASGFLPSRPVSIAAADLQRALTGLVETYGAQLISTQPVDSPAQDGLIRVALRVNLRGSLDALVPILHRLESQRPYLFLDALHLQGRTVPAAVQRPDADFLQARFEISGYMRAAP